MEEQENREHDISLVIQYQYVWYVGWVIRGAIEANKWSVERHVVIRVFNADKWNVTVAPPIRTRY